MSGYFTAQCRKTWLEDYRKDRSDLRNHLYDAMVLSHIPPGGGLNSVEMGGIFETAMVRQPGGGLAPAYRPLKSVGPDWKAFDAVNRDSCLVRYPRSSAPKTKRFDETIYGVEAAARTLPDGSIENAPRLRVREVIAPGGWPADDAEKWFEQCSRRSPEFAALFPESKWRAWIEQNAKRKAEGGDPVPLISGGGPVRSVSVDASKPAFFDSQSLAFHAPVGVKNPTERNIAVRLFEFTTPSGRKRIDSRVVAHPRFKRLQAEWAKRGFPVEADAPLPDGAVEVARVSKGDSLRIPLTREGDVAEDPNAAYSQIWTKVTAIKSSGQIEATPSEFSISEIKVNEAGVVTSEGSRIFGLRVRKVYKFQTASLLAVVKNSPAIVT